MGKKKGKKKPEPIVLVLNDEQRSAICAAAVRLGEKIAAEARDDLAKFFTSRNVEEVTNDYQNSHKESLESLIFGEKLAALFGDDIEFVFGDDIVTLRTPEEQAEIDAKKTKGKGKKGAKKNGSSTTATPSFPEPEESTLD